MRRYGWLACVLVLLSVLSPASAPAQSTTVEPSDYHDLFGDGREGDGDAPHSLGEARAKGKAYRLGQTNSVYRKPSQESHEVRQGDTLWDISARYYGDPYHWPELWSYNPEITNPHWIYPLDHVRLSANDQEQLAAAVAASGRPGAAPTFKEPKHGLPTDLAPSVKVPAKLLAGDAIFLRDEGYLDDDEIKASGSILAAGEELMLLSDSDIVYVRFNKDEKVEVGQTYTVYRPVYQWEREIGEHGKLVRIQGSLLINSYDPQKHVARAFVTETIDPIERGMPVILMERRFILEPARPNRSNVVAHIIGSAQPRQLLSDGNVVFLDVGNDKGILPGNRFFVVRQGDEWQEVLQHDSMEMGNIMPIPKYDRSELPKEVIAEIRVVKVRKKVTIAVVTHSTTDIFQGDKVEMRVGY